MSASTKDFKHDIAVGVISGAAVSAVGWGGSKLLTWLPTSFDIPIWVAVTSLAGTGTACWLLGLWIGVRRQSTQPTDAADPSADAEPIRSDDQIAVIQALRFYDDEYQSIDSVQRILARAGRSLPKSDARVILQELSDMGWAQTQFDGDTFEHWYRLTGRGVQFAKERGFTVSGS